MRSQVFSAALTGASLFVLQPAFAGQAPTTNPDAVPEQVVITASPFGENAIDQSASVSQVTREQLLNSGGIGLGDVLKDVPGVTSSGFSAGTSRPIIRGLGATRVRVTENGLGSHDVADVGDDHAVPIDPLASLDVEVLRGPATLRYGSQAIGGVVNAINNRIPLDVGEGSNVESFAGMSSGNLERLGGGLADYREGNWAFHADGVIRGADDYDTPQGTQINTFAFGRGYALGGAYIGDGGTSGGLGYNRYIAHYGIASEPGDPERKHIDLDQKNYNSAMRFMAPLPGITSLNVTGGYSNYRHDEVTDADGISALFTNKEWEGRAEAVHEGFGPITTGAIGIQYDNRDFGVTGEDAAYLHPTKTGSFAAYVFEEAAVTDQFKLQGAARIEWTDLKGNTDAAGDLKRSFAPISYSLGAVYKPVEDTSFFTNFSETARAPAPTELFAQGAHDAPGTFETGDPDIGLEKAFSMEGGVKHQDKDGNIASATVYRTRYNGFIDGFLTGNTCDEDGNCGNPGPGDFKQLFYVQKDATFWGFEGQVHWHVLDAGTGRVGIDLQTDYVRATLQGGTNVPRIPPLRYGGGLFFESTLVELRLSVLRADSQDKTDAHETPTPGFTNVDASAVFHVYRGQEGDFDVALVATNLTDAVERNAVSFTKDHVLQPGRAFRIMLHYMH
ncbi:MAG TPA: TonB-dependent receptor [Micropepsaceae bacterium]